MKATRTHISFVLLMPLLLVSASSPAMTELGRPEVIRFETSPRGHILVAVSINESPPLTMSLDTAAGRSSMTPEAAKRLGLSGIPGESVTTLGVHGSTENPVVRIDSLSMGEQSFPGMDAVVLGLDHITRGEWKVDGILGMDILQRFDLRLDFRKKTVELHARAESRDACSVCPEGVDGSAFETIDPGFVILPVTVDGKKVKAVLDTGSGHSGLNTKTAEALGVTIPASAARETMGAHGHGLGLQTGPIALGGLVLTERTNVRVMDHPTMEALGLADGPAMLMGTDQLTGRMVSISYGLRQIFVD